MWNFIRNLFRKKEADKKNSNDILEPWETIGFTTHSITTHSPTTMYVGAIPTRHFNRWAQCGRQFRGTKTTKTSEV
jgi:hypothetical protein